MSLGIDLASRNHKTAVCVIEWGAATAVAHAPQLGVGADDELGWLVDLCRDAQSVGIDAPFGWPSPMVNAVADWAQLRPWPASTSRELRLRLTDQHVHHVTGLTPLSPSSERIAIVAWRCARLLSLLASSERPVDRTGADGIYEVYPAAALTAWGLDRAGYKTRGNAAAKLKQRDARARLADELAGRAQWLDLSNARDACVESDDALDAVIAALVARAAARSKTIPAPAGQDAATVEREGWIHLPRPDALTELL